ncbi:non-ribosomal peptide synthetase [Nemania abortiva]|nr:non-ribosomal peptide synthetase [Nemania abortiva]
MGSLDQPVRIGQHESSFVPGDAHQHHDSLYKQAAWRLGLDWDKIENILPCTPFQLDVIDCAAHDGRHAVGHVVFEIPANVDVERLAVAWRDVVGKTPALRTCIFTSKAGESYQIVLRQSFFAWAYLKSLDMKDAVVQDEAGAAMAGPRCNRYAVLEDPNSKRRILIWTFSHALVDKSLQHRVLQQVLAAYDDEEVQHVNGVAFPANSVPVNMERAAQFWQQHFDGLNASVFPHLPSHQIIPHPDAQLEHRISYPNSVQQKWPNSTVCRAALAVLLARFTNASEALFGVVTERAHTLKKQGRLADGPTRTVVPIRIPCRSNQSASEIMLGITAHDHAMREFEHAGLCNISRAGDDGSAACGFQTVLLVTDGDALQAPSSVLQRNIEESDGFVPCSNRALLLNCRIVDNSASLVARYDQSVIDTNQMARFLRQLGYLIQQFQSDAVDLPLGQLDIITQDDRAEIENWNSEHLRVNEVCIHDVIAKRAANTPSQPAVAAWDGEWTYAELENVSSRLATYVRSLTLGQGQEVIPICFEKSKWVVAGILAVLKAGRAYTLIDPSSPPARNAQICRQTSAAVALTSKLHYDMMRAIVNRCIVIDDEFFQSLPCDEIWVKPVVKPQDLAYVLFTSGSTGEPKGSMIEHQGFASCAIKFGPALGINSHTRALQFASYAFGASLLEIVTTLVHGGCVCIPSDEDRMNNVPGFIKRFKVNWALLTPSFIGTIPPESVPGLQTLVLVGEPMSKPMRDTWAPRVQLLNGYGQSESATIASVTKINTLSPEPNNIGRAIGARFWIVDPNEFNRLVPIGCIGELVIESPGVAREYIVPLPQDQSPFVATAPDWYPAGKLPDGVKFYKTGDLVCYRSDGTVVYLGRRDSQVKIRGQRVETGEVEVRLRQQLSSHIIPVVEAVKRPDSSHSTVLIAFLVGPTKGEEDDVSAIPEVDAHILNHSVARSMNAKLQKLLPQHSIPSYYIRMKDLPHTATGKTDRRRLRSIATELLGEQVHNTTSHPVEKVASSATSIEAKLREVWFRCLNLDPYSNNGEVNFFEFGGDSITAIKMVNMARLSGIALTVTEIFQNPTLTGLIDVLGQGSAPYNQIPTTKYDGPVEQSFAQGRLWFLDQLNLGASWYHIPYGVRMRGPLRIDSLTTALLALEQRHETLRTTFEERDGVGVQVVHSSLIKGLRIIDVPDNEKDNYLQLLQQEQTAPFDVSSEAGWRVSLIRLGEDDHILCIVMHHIISDGWSIDVLRKELSQFYTAALQGRDPLSVIDPLPVHYRDFSIWQKQEEQVAEHQRQLKYWSTQLKDSTPAEFLTDLPRPTILSGHAGFVPVTIDGELYRNLRKFCQAHKTTSFAVLLAAFRAAHYRFTGVDDATIGTPIANRNRRELENMIGFFVNTQCMRITVNDDDTFESLVRQVRSTTTAAFEHQDVPFENIVSALLPGSRDASRNPLVQLMFAVHGQPDLGKFELDGLEGEPLQDAVVTRFDQEFHLFQEVDKLSGKLVFAADLFKLESIQNVVNVFFQILRRGLDQPQTPIAVLPLTDGLAELRDMGLLEIERTKYPRDSSVIDVFRDQVAASSHDVAVIDASSSLTYAELDHQSDQLATWLRRRNMPAETMVGVLAPRSCQTIAAFLGIMKANLAYLPLDVRSPAARLEAILSTMSQHKLVLLGSDTSAPQIKLSDVEMVRISDTLEHRATNGLNGHADVADVQPSATSLAYVIFTSGSTGKPKGVMTEHRNIVRLAKEKTLNSKLPPATKMAHLSNIAFDAATWEIYTALLNGGTLVCVDYMTVLDSEALKAVFLREQVNVAFLQPALLKQYLADIPTAFGGLDLFVVGGDRLDVRDGITVQSLVGAGTYQAYGPTENGAFSTIYNMAGDDAYTNGVPIGRAISNSGTYIMDSHQQLVPSGVMGELVVTGDGLARGYLDSTLDPDRFIHVTVDGQVVRAYRTGDRVRYRPGDGQIEFFGRIDQQVKIRGHRIEPAEVERAIVSQASVLDAAVVVVRNQNGQEPEMVGFVETQDDQSADQGEEAGSQVKGWESLFESSTYADINTIEQSVVGSDFMGWTSMYDGSEIDKAEMREWLDDTMHTLLDGQAPGNVLEIGSGTGMILFNLGAGLERYVGFDPSKSAAAFVNSAINSIPGLRGKAEVHVGTATDIHRLNGFSPDLVVINSVMQYFPTPEYLLEVVETLVRIPGVKRLFFGDVRSHATNEQFLAARALHTLGDKPTKDSVRQMIAELKEREEEMLVDPGFFTALESRLPDLIRHVEILPKKMQATNELSAYRYAVIIHMRNSEENLQPVYPIKMNDWIDFQASQMDRHTLLQLLQHSADASTVAVSNIPYSKTIFERHIVESLNKSEDDAQPSLDGAAWVSAVRSNAKSCASLSKTDLIQLGEEAGFRVEVSCARQWSQSGALDAVFHHYPPAREGARVLVRFPTDDQGRKLATLSNRPLQRLQSRRLVSKIREGLQALLPSYMIPARIVVIDQMPLNASGKVDRKELVRRAQIAPKQAAAPKREVPINEIETVLCEEFADVFGVDVSTTDSFFRLGGHSLMATKLAARLGRRLNTRVSVRDVFDQPIVADLAATIRKGLKLHSTMASNGHSGQMVSAGVAPRNDIEAVLCKELADVLGMDVGITDNFFDLGGHSLMATKLAARLSHQLATPVSVKDIFDHPAPIDLASRIELIQSERDEATNSIQTSNNASFQLLNLEDPQTFIQREISPQLEQSSEIIQDVYPTTQIQKLFLRNPTTGNPYTLTPWCVDFPPDTDCANLARACTSLVERFDIFRTAFLVAADELYQVVLKHLDVPIKIIETEENINTATRAFLDEKLRQPVMLGQPLLRITIFKKEKSPVRLVLRMSHALYDGLSVEHVLHSLHVLYRGGSLPMPHRFGRYMQHMADSRKDGYEFWRSVLQDSSMTVIDRDSNGTRQKQASTARTYRASKAIYFSLKESADSRITPATVFTAACALTLSKETGSKDVLFGRVVSGRQGLPIGCQNICGPCTNEVPVRLRTDGNANPIELLREAQEQYLNSLPFETLGFDELKQNCTDWPDATKNFGCGIAYQNLNHQPESEMQDQRVQMGVMLPDDQFANQPALHDLAMVGEPEPEGDRIQVTVVANQNLCENSRVERILAELCENIQTLILALRNPYTGNNTKLASQALPRVLPIKTPKMITKSIVQNSSQKRVFILGVGNLGKFVAHSLRKQHPSLPITLLFHRADLVSEWEAAGRAITCVTDHLSDERTGFDIELLSDSTDENSPIEHLIVATKTYMTTSAIDLVKGRLRNTSNILFLQNGICPVDEVSDLVFSDTKSRPTYWAGVCSSGIYRKSPFSIVFAGRGPLVLGQIHEASNGFSNQASATPVEQDFMVQHLLDTPVLEATLATPKQIKEVQLQKLIVNSMINPLTAIFRCHNGELFTQPPRLALMRALLEEAGEIVRAILPGKSTNPQFTNERLLASVRRVAEMTGECTNSMLQDVQVGRRTEIDDINGYLALQAKRHSFTCANNDTLINLVKQRRAIMNEDIESLFDLSGVTHTNFGEKNGSAIVNGK